MFAAQAAIAIENAQLYKENQQLAKSFSTGFIRECFSGYKRVCF